MEYVLVTGACGGMGAATVAALRAAGFGVIALDRVPFDGAEGVWSVQADLTQEESVRGAFETVRAITDRLFAVVHFAGIYVLDSLVEMESRDFERAFRVNLGGAFLVNRIFLPMLQPGGRIVMTTSELAVLDPLPFTGVYAITKSALDGYAYSLRMELQLLEIPVSVLRAGAVRTGMLNTSTAALERFCEKTERYAFNAKRFRAIVDRVETRCVPPEKIARKVMKILRKKRPKFAYAINRNPLLMLLDLLPKRMRFWAIRKVLQ